MSGNILLRMKLLAFIFTLHSIIFYSFYTREISFFWKHKLIVSQKVEKETTAQVGLSNKSTAIVNIVYRITTGNERKHSSVQQSETVLATANSTILTSLKSTCPESPPNLQGNISSSLFNTSVPMSQIENANPDVLKGGHYVPTDCVARFKVAIIIPFRDREEHLSIFLQNMHPVLQRQQLEYRIYVINQFGNDTFNRAKLMNVGFRESLKDLDFDCFVFHDVDLILHYDKCLYSCYDQPRHLSTRVFKSGKLITARFGGVTQLTKAQFEKVNGYSNEYWGWGGEDEDMWIRITKAKMKIIQDVYNGTNYRMVLHDRDVGNKENPLRFLRMKKALERLKNDGLNNLKYKVILVEENKLYTNMTVDLLFNETSKDWRP